MASNVHLAIGLLTQCLCSVTSTDISESAVNRLPKDVSNPNPEVTNFLKLAKKASTMQ